MSKQVKKEASPYWIAFKDITGGTIGGIGLVFVGHPFDTLKVRLQTQSHTNPIYSGLGDCIKKTYAAEGVGGFYKGVASPLLGQAVFNAVQFFAYGKAKQIVHGSSNTHDMTIAEYYAAGALTGATVAFVEGPIDLFKTQLQTKIFQPKPQYTSFTGCVSHITRHHGLRGWYQGLSATIFRNVPAVSCYFGIYETARRAMASSEGIRVDQLSSLQMFGAGCLGGFAYWVGTYPIDVVKSAMMADACVKSERRYSGVLDTFRQLYAERGVKGFFRGLTPCLLRAAPANGVCFMLYELTVKLMD